MDLAKMKEFAYKKGIKMRTLAENVGMSEQNLHRCVRENKIQASDLEKISSALGVSVTIFFDEVADVRIEDHHAETSGRVLHAEGSGVINTGCADSKLEMEIEHLKALLAEKDARLAEKDARIEELKERINELKGK